MTQLDRRQFLTTASVLGVSTLVPGTVPGQTVQPESQWFRGNLHTHTQWSDGLPLPEWAVAWYKDRGYHFLCPSDHNTFQDSTLRFDAWCGGCKKPANMERFKNETSRWKVVGKNKWGQLRQENLDQAIAKFGADSIRSIQEGDTTYYRLKTFDELVAQFAEPGKFLLIPGFEQTGGSLDHRQVHMNFINVRGFFPYMAGETVQQTVDQTYAAGKKLFSGNAEPYMFTLNHPIWPYYDIEPDVLINNTAIRFFELNNSGLSYPKHAKGWTPDKYWDVVNAFRVSAGKQLVLATGTDDEHSYERETPRSWMVVRAKSLTWPALYEAMCAGDSYTSNGLNFADIQFDRKTGTLYVKCKPIEGVKCRIEFIGTKKNFNKGKSVVDVPKEGRAPARQIGQWSPEIGRCLKMVEAEEASYTLADDDLYVRVRYTVVSALPQFQDKYPVLAMPGAWTQPYSLLVK